MRGQKQQAFLAGQRALEVLEAFIDYDLADVLWGVAGEQAYFGNLPAKRGEFAAKDFSALAGSFFREGQRQISHANAAQLAVEQIDNPSEGNAFGTGQWPGQQAYR